MVSPCLGHPLVSWHLCVFHLADGTARSTIIFNAVPCTMWLTKFVHRRSVAERPLPVVAHVLPETPWTIARRELRNDMKRAILARHLLWTLAISTTYAPSYRHIFDIIVTLGPAALDSFVRESIEYLPPRSLEILSDIYPFY